MSFRTYHPRRGDLVHVNFSPSTGHEMTGRHYGIVLSSIAYSRKSGMALVCAITSRVRGGPFEVPVPSGLLPEKAGVGAVNSVIVADSIRQVGYSEREVAFVSFAPSELVDQVLDCVLAVLEDE